MMKPKVYIFLEYPKHPYLVMVGYLVTGGEEGGGLLYMGVGLVKVVREKG
jgi:hypothetical protein